MRPKLIQVVALAVGGLCASSVVAQECAPQDLKLLTGPEHTYYNNLGKAIQQVARQVPRDEQLSICLPPVKKTLASISELAAGKADFALVQSDVAHDAWYGHPPAFPRRAANVRLVMPLYTEAVHIILRPHLNIAHLSDLKGRKIWLGLPGSGTEYTAKHLLAAVGIHATPGSSDLSLASVSDYCDAVQRLKKMDGKGGLDAFFRVTLVPSADIQDAMKQDGMNGKPSVMPAAGEKCQGTSEIQILPLDYDLVDRLVQDGSYIETLIPRSAYDRPTILTVGVQALLVTIRKDGDPSVRKLARMLRTKRARIEDALKNLVEQDHKGHSHSRIAPQMSLLGVPPSEALYWVADSGAKKEFYNPWRDSWKPLLPVMSVGLFVFFPLLVWKRLPVLTALVARPKLTFTVAGAALIWLVTSCFLYHFEWRVNELFNSLPNSLISTFLYLVGFPGVDLLTRGGQSSTEIIKWISVLLFGGFLGPEIKQALEAVFKSLVEWCEREAQALNHSTPLFHPQAFAPKAAAPAFDPNRPQAANSGAD